MANGGRSDWRVSNQIGGGFISWRPGFGLPLRWTTTLDRADFPYVVELDFATDEADGPQCRTICFKARSGDESISARRIRDIRVAECIQLAITSAAVRETRRPGEVAYELGGVGDISEQARLARPVDERTSDERLREVAEIYRAANEETGKPTQAVYESLPFGYSYSTAARLVMEARRRGFLPPTKRRGRSSTKED